MGDEARLLNQEAKGSNDDDMMNADIQITVSTLITDYNKPVTVTLPPEAYQAPEAPQPLKASFLTLTVKLKPSSGKYKVTAVMMKPQSEP
ncbi:MAG: hypothetical protein DRJ60_05520 [Thermoprotei archaeon]|nr:MAG: hypothetical protein DRJ60_05520 [Thermoprotei archaeon]